MTHNIHIRSPPAIATPSVIEPISSPTELEPVKNAATYTANSRLIVIREAKNDMRSNKRPKTGVVTRRITAGIATVSSTIEPR